MKNNSTHSTKGCGQVGLHLRTGLSFEWPIPAAIGKSGSSYSSLIFPERNVYMRTLGIAGPSWSSAGYIVSYRRFLFRKNASRELMISPTSLAELKHGLWPSGTWILQYVYLRRCSLTLSARSLITRPRVMRQQEHWCVCTKAAARLILLPSHEDWQLSPGERGSEGDWGRLICLTSIEGRLSANHASLWCMSPWCFPTANSSAPEEPRQGMFIQLSPLYFRPRASCPTVTAPPESLPASPLQHHQTPASPTSSGFQLPLGGVQQGLCKISLYSTTLWLCHRLSIQMASFVHSLPGRSLAFLTMRIRQCVLALTNEVRMTLLSRTLHRNESPLLSSLCEVPSYLQC